MRHRPDSLPLCYNRNIGALTSNVRLLANILSRLLSPLPYLYLPEGKGWSHEAGGAVPAVQRELAEHRLEKRRELRFGHLARGYCQVNRFGVLSTIIF